MRPTIAYLGAPEGFEALTAAAAGRAATKHVSADTAALTKALGEAAGLLDASMRVPVTAAMLEASPALRIISCATTGSDHIARPVAEARGIVIRTLREDGALLRNITPAAELSWTLLMACARKLPGALDHVLAGKWVREEFPGTMLHGKRLGLIGMGRIGGWMARYGRVFGMDVVGNDPHLANPLPDVHMVPLPALFETCDFISVHVHLNEETRGLVSADLLQRVKPGAVLINTSRGAIVDERALVAALEGGRLGAAGLDVVEGEPNIDQHPLVQYARTHANLLITPHIGGFSPDAVRIVCRRAAEKILEHLGLTAAPA